jgi:hypothetical protein
MFHEDTSECDTSNDFVASMYFTHAEMPSFETDNDFYFDSPFLFDNRSPIIDRSEIAEPVHSPASKPAKKAMKKYATLPVNAKDEIKEWLFQNPQNPYPNMEVKQYFMRKYKLGHNQLVSFIVGQRGRNKKLREQIAKFYPQSARTPIPVADSTQYPLPQRCEPTANNVYASFMFVYPPTTIQARPSIFSRHP